MTKNDFKFLASLLTPVSLFFVDKYFFLSQNVPFLVFWLCLCSLFDPIKNFEQITIWSVAVLAGMLMSDITLCFSQVLDGNLHWVLLFSGILNWLIYLAEEP